MLRLAPESAAASSKDAAVAERAQLEVSALYEQHGREFLHYATALGRDEELARDALQESFMRYFVARCSGDEISTPRAWIYRVMHNYLLDRIKEERCHCAYRAHRRMASHRDQDIEGECFRQEFLLLIRKALTPREYACFRLRTEGLRYEEIAATLELTSGTVGAMVHRAIGKLQKLMLPERGKV
jgi:RNA polymerase sigma-70 factor, ECF subfamily